MSLPTKTALIIGATGQVGGYLLKDLLSSPAYSKVGEYGRRVTKLDGLPATEKLEQKTIDFEKLDEAGLAEGKWDVVFITMGTTAKNAGSSAAFEKIDREYVVNAAKAAKVAGTSQRLVYVSSIGSNPKSSFLYPRSKGLTELGLAALGYDDTIVFRPGHLGGTNRPESRPAEAIGGMVIGLLGKFSSDWGIGISTLAKSLLIAGRLGSSGLPPAAKATTAGEEGAKFTLITNAGALALAAHE
ncbi:unnamed protein product [Mycena citricolor]|uniref:NAD(P)-binding domain-containing protein n=1 Tax=Mycena citricolor TaxID=2018698 RepID=A0AAD2HDQ1_9AGAR|nr:unnamed protein product [Mycena citricolor]CAK5273772.1 unnamed protein product [Mycena citricolor]